MKLGELLERLGSAEPAPGGGAAAALAGALGAALVQMTANLTLGRPKLADVQEQAATLEAASAGLRHQLGRLADADTAAFAGVSAAYKLPREDTAQKTERSMAIQAALRQAAAVPLETAQLCAAVLDLAEQAAPLLNSAVISDVMVGALLTQAALESAALNVEVNLASMSDSHLVDELRAQVDQLRAGSTARLGRILAAARSRLKT
jgi:formiminotetrahydrofolate cyclodeaminase